MAKFKVGDMVSTKDDLLWFVVASANADGRFKIVRRSNRWDNYDDYEEDASEWAIDWEKNNSHVGYAMPEALSMVKEY